MMDVLNDMLLASVEQKNRDAARCLGLISGIVGGALAGWICTWLIACQDQALSVSLVAAVIGGIGGLYIGNRNATDYSSPGSPDIASVVLSSCASIPGMLVLMGGIGMVHGKASGLMALGFAFAFPMLGLVIGGMMDRVFQSICWTERGSVAESGKKSSL